MNISMKPYSLILIGLVITTGFSAILYQHYTTSQTPQQQGITVGLDIKAYHDGQDTPYATRYLPNDLILDNFNNLLMAMFGQSTTKSECAAITTEDGTVGYLFGIWDNTVCTAFLLGMSATGCNTIPYCGGRIEIGTGNAVGRTDYKLVTQYGSDITVASSSCVAGSTDSVVVSGSVPITSTVTITEAGLAIFSENAINLDMLFFHDSFTGIATINGDTITVQYTINLNNSGFNVNLCATLAGLFTGSVTTINYPSYTGVPESLKSTTGGTNTFYIWCDSGAYTALLATTSTCTNPVSTNAAYIAIGTGSTAFTPTSVSLVGQIATATITSYQYISAYGEIYWGVSFNIGTTNTISEAGIFLILSGGNYMFAADTFTGQTETANQAWGMTLQVLD